MKWAGGKRWLVPHLRALWPPHAHRRLVEPFCGGLAVALGLTPERALLNDANVHLVNFYRHIQQGLTIELEMRNDERLYYEHRERFNELIATGHQNSVEAASLFYFLNRNGFNGLCRFNNSGKFNVPFGRYKTVAYRRDFAEYREKLSGWKFSA